MKTKFKGTSGKWRSCCIETSPHYVFAHEDNVTICRPYMEQDSGDDLSLDEYRANALLISKAPELLSMLESIVQGFESDYVVRGEIVDSPYEWLQDRYKEAKQLIEEATNI